VRGGGEIDERFVMFDAQQIQKQTRAVCMPGQRMKIDLHGKFPDSVDGRAMSRPVNRVSVLAARRRIASIFKSPFSNRER
jgi:hypothetical protein